MTIRRAITAAATALGLLAFAPGASADIAELVGTANWTDGTQLPAGAVVEVRLIDVSTDRAGGIELSSIVLSARRDPPLRFRLLYDAAMIDSNRAYRLVGEARVGELTYMRTLRGKPVITEGPDGDVELLLERIDLATETGESPIGRVWHTVSVMGEAITQPVIATLELGEDGSAAGNAGCNRFTGSADIGPEILAFGNLAVTKRGCQSPIMRLERDILRAMRTVRGWRITEGKLQLLDAAGSVVMTYEEGR